MAYLGNVPARSFISFERQVFTIVNSQTAYTLSHSVTNENDIRLVVNNVVQEPGSGKAYTATGTTLTLSAALTNGTDEMYCVFLGRAVGTVNAPAGSVGTSQLVDLNVTTGKIAADAITNAKIADDAISDEQLDPTVITGQTAETSIATDDLILLSDTSASGALRKMTRANFVSGIGGTNTPYFEAYIASNQTMSDNTTTKLNFDTETYDSGGMYDTTNKRFLPTVAGRYFIYFQVTYDKQAVDQFHNCHTYIKVNGSTHKTYYCDFYDNYTPYALVVSGHTIMDFNGSSDYVEIFGNFNVTSGTGVVNNASFSTFGAYKLIE